MRRMSYGIPISWLAGVFVCDAYQWPYLSSRLRPDHPYVGRRLYQSHYTRPRGQSCCHGRRSPYKKTPPKDDLQKITMPYQQGQPTSSSPLLTTHSTTASSAMSTHTKGDPRTHHLCTKSQPIPVPSHHADFHPAHIYLHGSTYRDTALCVVEKRHRPPPPHVITIPPPIFTWDILNPNACFPRDMVRPSKLPDKGRHPSAQQLEFIKGRAFLRRRMVANRALPRRRRGIFRRISTLAD